MTFSFIRSRFCSVKSAAYINKWKILQHDHSFAGEALNNCKFQNSYSVSMQIRDFHSPSHSKLWSSSYLVADASNRNQSCGLNNTRQPKRQLWGWLNSVFNSYDDSRVEQVGPNRACAEWLLRCGASLRWKSHSNHLKDYNSLPVGGPRLTIAEVDATDSAIMGIGFEHFKGCCDIERLVIHKATYVDDEALMHLRPLRKSLTHLQISACGNVTDKGLKILSGLSNLKYLLLYDFIAVKDKEDVVRHLKEKLPECEVVFTYASNAEYLRQQKEKEEQQIQDDTNK